jgi:hypothetical protein
MSFRSNPYNEVLAQDTAAHVAVQHERHATEHLLLDEAPSPGKLATDPIGELFAEGHGSLRMRSNLYLDCTAL